MLSGGLAIPHEVNEHNSMQLIVESTHRSSLQSSTSQANSCTTPRHRHVSSSLPAIPRPPAIQLSSTEFESNRIESIRIESNPFIVWRARACVCACVMFCVLVRACVEPRSRGRAAGCADSGHLREELALFKPTAVHAHHQAQWQVDHCFLGLPNRAGYRNGKAASLRSRALQCGCCWVMTYTHQRQRAPWGWTSLATAVASACGGKTGRQIHRKCLVARVGRQRVRGCGYEEHLNRGNQRYERKEARIITRADIFVVHACAVGVQDHDVRHFAGVVQGVDFAVLDVTYVPPVVLAEDVEFGGCHLRRGA